MGGLDASGEYFFFGYLSVFSFLHAARSVYARCLTRGPSLEERSYG